MLKGTNDFSAGGGSEDENGSPTATEIIVSNDGKYVFSGV